MAGIGLCLFIAIISLFLNNHIPVGSITISILLGILIGNVVRLNKRFDAGIKFCEKHFLAIGIGLMGVNLNYRIVEQLGISTILLIAFAIGMTVIVALSLGRWTGIDNKLALLLGIGNGICGTSAILATREIVGANKEQAGLSVTVVNFLGTIGLFFMPLLSSVLLGYSDVDSGIYIGNTLQAVGHVVASGFSISESTGQVAVLVKMVRVLMLTPLILILLLLNGKNKISESGPQKGRQVPLFIIGFILCSLLPTFNIIDQAAISTIGKAAKILLSVAMAGIGLKITLLSIRKFGKSAFLVGGGIFIFQILLSGCLIWMIY